MNAERRRATTLVILVMTLMPGVALAQSPNPKNLDEQYAAYLEAARKPPVTNGFWISNLVTDASARRKNDLVTIRVQEEVTASGAADLSIGKKSSAAVAFPGSIGTQINKVLPMSSDTAASGQGSTSRTTSMTAMMTGVVKDVLPNGDLVIEGLREIDINGDRQVVVLTGVVRVLDILPGNIAPSTRIGQLRIRSVSQGVMKDSLTPGWLIRVLNKIF
jgi:flagellar L-ring protein precursor FlgH